jgi:nucleotide-binding universal stress UspA family protein
MKILIGAANLPQGELILNVAHDLGFPTLQARFVHVVDTPINALASQFSAYTSPFLFDDNLEHAEEEAQNILNHLLESARGHGIMDTHAQLLYGNVGNEILNCADAQESDILALGSSRKSTLESIMLGSTSQKVVINSKTSVLIVKESYMKSTGLTVVLATDHSPYASRWIDKFLSWSPRGIKKLTLVSVLPANLRQSLPASMKHLKAASWMEDGLRLESQRVLEKFKALGCPSEFRVETGDVNDALTRVMQETKSNLLVLGSQGHGYMERLAVGSVSLKQAIKRNYSVLIVRE